MQLDGMKAWAANMAQAVKKNAGRGLYLAAALGTVIGVAVVCYEVATYALTFLANFFLVKFLLLVAVYIFIFAFLIALVKYSWPRLAGKPTPETTFRDVVHKTFYELGTNNNRRWEFLVAMTIVTFVIALDNPGVPLFISGLSTLPSETLSPETLQHINRGWTFFMHGNRVSKPAASLLATTEPTWFWWQVFFLLLTLTFGYFFVAFWDETVKAAKKFDEVVKKGWEEHQKKKMEEKQVSVVATPPSTPPIDKATAGPQKTPASTTVTATASEGGTTPSGATATATVNSAPPSPLLGLGSKWKDLAAAGILGNILIDALIEAIHVWVDHRRERTTRRPAYES